MNNRKKIVAANWKMNTLRQEAIDLTEEILQGTREQKNVFKLIFPPFPFLAEIASRLAGENGFSVGAQNCSRHAKGAYTGEVAASMIHSVNAKFVLIGHSERRGYFNEKAEELLEKVKQALEAELDVVFCVGEVLDERQSGKHEQVVRNQLEEVLGKISKEQIKRIVLAYEPVWAIGTGETATPVQAQEMHACIRKWLNDTMGKNIAETMPILYGGSCNAQNARELFSCADVDGGLIGGASLKAKEFSAIVNSF